MQFVYKIAQLAEEQHHHPSILIEYDKVKLSWWTHKVKGLHINDFIMAAKVDDWLKIHALD
jgi:4a-hydroxytetrahydrobiopterin dehydratase